MTDREKEWLVCFIVAVALAFFCVGCSRLPRIKTAETTVRGIADAGKPATLDTIKTEIVVPLPAGTQVSIPSVDSKPIFPVFTLPSATNATVTTTEARASTGTVDNAVALRKTDNAARLPLLYAAIGAAALGVLMVFLRFPGPAALCGLASGVFFIAWQAAGLPQWFWVAGVAAIAVGAGLYFGFERRDKQDGKAS